MKVLNFLIKYTLNMAVAKKPLSPPIIIFYPLCRMPCDYKCSLRENSIVKGIQINDNELNMMLL